MWVIAGLAEELSASQEGLCCVEVVVQCKQDLQ